MHVGLGAHLDFFDLDLGLGFSGQAFFFVFLEHVFAQVQDLADRRGGFRSDLDQVEVGFAGDLQGGFDWYDSSVFPIMVN